MSFKLTKLIAALAICQANLVCAELVLQTGEALSGDMTITADLGVTQGTNLLHTFESFNVRVGESATFTGPDVIANVIARVTGTMSTEINGTLRSTISSANLFLLNPNGIAVGPNAQLEVDGGLYLSTANSMSFSDGSVLLVSDSGNSTLTTSAPASFGFDVSPADITFENTVIETLELASGGFAARPIDSLHLTGGDILFDQSRVFLRGGDISIVSLAGSGDVAIGTVLTSTRSMMLGDVLITGSPDTISFSERLETSGDPAGRIQILANDLTLQDNALVFADTAGPQTGAGIEIKLTGDLNLTGGSRITTDVLDSGAGSDITIDAANIFLRDRFTIISSDNGSLGSGGGAIGITTGGLVLDESAQISSTTVGSGDGGTVTIDAETIQITGGASFSGQSTGAGRGGEFLINASESVSIAGLGSGIRVSTLFDGDAGNIDITTASLSLTNQAEISAVAEFFDSGSPGTVTINAQNVNVSGLALISTTNFSDLSPGGAVLITADQTTLSGASESIPNFVFSGIQSSTIGAAGGGNIQVIGNLSLSDGAAVEALTISTGNGGKITLAGNVLVDNARVDSRTLAQGNGGTIAISGDVRVENGGSIDTSTVNFATGDAGGIEIAGQTIVVTGSESIIASRTETLGAAGTINIDGAILVVEEGGVISTSTQSDAVGGSIFVEAVNIDLLNQGTITVTASGSGNAGNIDLLAGSALRVLDASNVETNAALSGGGNININVIDQIYLRDSTLTASSGGPEIGDDGGNVTIDPILFILDNSKIVAQAVQGNGGIINLIAENLLSDINSEISATSELGNDGDVVISSPDNSVTGVIGVLDASFSQEEALLSEPCAARVLRERSSLVISSRTAGHAAPDDYQWSAVSGCR
jgi:filamentous hemagglutinin family protein